ncbi:MAG: adenylyltransferase/cytidyltransferase family protein, partial [Actinobacteria bacterium]|nr:adenylyltransferase/cytidyltransferase family protein [Actinomycetota bacterium]
MSSVRRGLGILGGTFDPPHIGHIAAARAVFDALMLERVLLMVANEPWQKVGLRPLSEPEARLAMTKAAVE